jgi:hypothetical protein
MDAEITRVEVSRTVPEPAEAFRLLNDDDCRCGMVVHSAPKVNGPHDLFRDRLSEGSTLGRGSRPGGEPNARALHRDPAPGEPTARQAASLVVESGHVLNEQEASHPILLLPAWSRTGSRSQGSSCRPGRS